MVKFLKHQVKAIESQKIQSLDQKIGINVVQQPVKARVSGRKETRNSSRRLVDPQPIVQLKLQDPMGAKDNIVDHSVGIYFVRASIECVGFNDSETFISKQRKSRLQNEDSSNIDVLRGTTAVTVQFYKDSPYVACAVFDNLSVRFKGDYRLKFDLYEIRSFSKDGVTPYEAPKVIHWEHATTYSSKFTVFTDASFDGLEASPELNEQLKKAGCRIRTRKPKTSVSGASQSLASPGYKVSKQQQALKMFQNMQAAQMYPNMAMNTMAMPQMNMGMYFDSPVSSRAGTPMQHALDNTPAKSMYYTPMGTPQTTQTDVFATPMTHNAIVFDESYDTALDLSPVEHESILAAAGVHATDNSYALFNGSNDNNGNSQLLAPFSATPAHNNNLGNNNNNNNNNSINNTHDNMYAPRSQESILTMFDLQNFDSLASSMGSSVFNDNSNNNNNNNLLENPFAMDTIEFSF